MIARSWVCFIFVRLISEGKSTRELLWWQIFQKICYQYATIKRSKLIDVSLTFSEIVYISEN